MNTSLKTMLIAAAALTAASSFAQDKSTLDLLVKKGVITAEERAIALQDASEARAAAGLNKIFVKEDNTKRLTFSGRVQFQHESIDSSVNGGASNATTSDSFMRRLYLGLKVDMGEGFSGEIVNNFADNSLDKAIFTSENAYGTFVLGYQKVQWGLEENTSSSKLFTIERSAANRFWNESLKDGRLGFGARHTGLHYSNKYAIDPSQSLDYGFAVVNAIQGYDNKSSVAADSKTNNDIGTFANVAYTLKVTDTNKHTIGVNYGRSVFISTISSGTGTATTTDGSIDRAAGFNPYIKSQFDKLVVQADYMQTKIDKNGSNAERTPEGYNVIAAYKITDQLEAVIRYSALNTDGRGAKFSEVYRNAALVGNAYNKTESFYYGLNYYFVEHNAKIQFGYEKAKATERVGTIAGGVTAASEKADADIFRFQAQVLF